MSLTDAQFSEDQAEAYDQVSEALSQAGVDLLEGTTLPPEETEDGSVLAVIGKAGSGKTALLARLTQDLVSAGVKTVSGDWEGRRTKATRTLAILAPTNKAASV